MAKEWMIRMGLSLVAIAAFWTGRWVTDVDAAVAQVHRQEVRIALLEQMSRQQLDAHKKFSEALDDFRRVVAARR